MQKQTIREDLSAHRKPNRARTAKMCNFRGAEGAAGAVRVREAAAEQEAGSGKFTPCQQDPTGGRFAEKRKKSRHSVAGFLKD